MLLVVTPFFISKRYLILYTIIIQSIHKNAKNKDLKSILIIGSGPIVIGQACEFDYSGTQALTFLTRRWN